ncbi:MAG: hypothetical protein V4773_24130 [Verrucomicrobiota bacterium]
MSRHSAPCVFVRRLAPLGLALAFASVSLAPAPAQTEDIPRSRRSQGGGSSGSGSGGGDFDGARLPPPPPQPIFFPPHPPALGRTFGKGAMPGSNQPPAPPELADFVNEIFYPELGSRLFANLLKDAQRQQVDAYRTAKLALQNELRTELERLRNAEPAERLQALAALATRQAPRLAQLEKDAEQLRRELMHRDHTWGARREWRLGDYGRRGFSPTEIAQVMRAYAYYQNGLLPAQRRLLREISLELLLSAENETKAAAAQPHVFFPPEPARVLFPDHMSAEAAAKLAAYQTKKSLLKKELYDVVYRHDGQALGFLPGNAIASLAARQAPRLAELETLAEEVRRLLPPASGAPPVERSPLPLALSTRLSAMMNTYAAAQRAASAQIDAIIARNTESISQSKYVFGAEGIKFVVIPNRFSSRSTSGRTKIEAIRAEISAIADEYARTLAELLNERSAIREEIARTLGNTEAARIDATLYAAMRVVSQQETASAYEEYRVAVFEPGLSPEQRRLLFDSVVQKLDLPLPRGEPQPANRSDSW